MLMLILVAVLLTSCAINTPTSPLSVTKAEETTKINIDNGNTEKILSLFEGGEWINETPNCGYDFIFDYNGDVYRYHSECGTFYSLTDKQSLELNETAQTEVNDILKALCDWPVSICRVEEKKYSPLQKVLKISLRTKKRMAQKNHLWFTAMQFLKNNRCVGSFYKPNNTIYLYK